jgi:hypothetical protein
LSEDSYALPRARPVPGISSDRVIADILHLELLATRVSRPAFASRRVFILPLTTLAYAWMVNTRQAVAGINLVILIIAVVIDLGGLSGGEYHRRTRW